MAPVCGGGVQGPGAGVVKRLPGHAGAIGPSHPDGHGRGAPLPPRGARRGAAAPRPAAGRGPRAGAARVRRPRRRPPVHQPHGSPHGSRAAAEGLHGRIPAGRRVRVAQAAAFTRASRSRPCSRWPWGSGRTPRSSRWSMASCSGRCRSRGRPALPVWSARSPTAGTMRGCRFPRGPGRLARAAVRPCATWAGFWYAAGGSGIDLWARGTRSGSRRCSRRPASSPRLA